MREKLNRTQLLLTQTQRKALPKLYSQDGKGLDAIAYVKFFTPWSSWSWFASEYDPEEGIFFGLVVNTNTPEGELGYFSAKEFKECHGPFGLQIERDIHFEPTKLSNCR